MTNLDESTEEINRRFGIPNISTHRKTTLPDLTLDDEEDFDFDKDLGLNSSGILASNTPNKLYSPSKKKGTSSPPKRVSNDYQDHIFRMRSNPSSPVKNKTRPIRRTLFDDDLNESTDKFEYKQTHADLGDIGARKIKAAIDGLNKPNQEKEKHDVKYRDLYNDKDKLATQLLIINSDLIKENSRLRNNELKNNDRIAELQNWITGLQEKTKKYKQLYLKTQRKLNDLDQDKTQEIQEKEEKVMEIPQVVEKNDSNGISLEDVKLLLEKLNNSIDKLAHTGTQEKSRVDEKDLSFIFEELLRKVKDKQTFEPPKQYFNTRDEPLNPPVTAATVAPAPAPTSSCASEHVPVHAAASVHIPLATPAGTAPATAPSQGPIHANYAPVETPAPGPIPTNYAPAQGSAPGPIPTVYAPTQPSTSVPNHTNYATSQATPAPNHTNYAPSQASAAGPIPASQEPNRQVPKSNTPANKIESPITNEQLKLFIKALTSQGLTQNEHNNKDPHIYVDCRLCFDSKDQNNIDKNGICKRCTKEVLTADSTINKLGGEWLPL
ncbi:hypothetical protein JA1_000646 [Spathaspora sp. JA1]|nr:hypothetical protein JA1_000646 [Spathaspora sp. JA1]